MRRASSMFGTALALFLLLQGAQTALAQDAKEAAAAKEAEAPVKDSIRGILASILIPERAEEAREAGVPEDDIRVILEESTRWKFPPEDTGVLLEETAASVRENGPIDNFGAFVQARLADGLRGRDLANAIHAEHQARGKGKGQANREKMGKGDQGPEHGSEGKNKGKGGRG